MLCSECHREKSDSTLQKPDNPILSHFSPYTYEAFVKSPKTQQAILYPNAVDLRQQVLHIDARRCRRNCLVESTYQWCVFSCHDEIRPAEQTLGDYNWIDKGIPKGRGYMLSMLPYDGVRWSPRQATEYLMRPGRWQQVTWGDIKYTFSSTAHLPAIFLSILSPRLQRAFQS